MSLASIFNRFALLKPRLTLTPMARRRKTNLLEDLVSVFALLPWWLCLALGALSYFVLHGQAVQPGPLSLTPDQVPRAMFGSMFKAAAMVGQFLVPLACVMAAGVSAAGRRRRRALVAGVANASQNRAPDALHDMSWREFEHLVGEGFRLQGYQVLETGGGGPDGGVDLVLSRRGEKYLVQCKQWKAFKVGVEIVRELYGVMAARGVAGGFVVTSGSFTAEATAFAAGRNVQLVDGTTLFGMLQQARAANMPVSSAPPAQRKPATPFVSAPVGVATTPRPTATAAPAMLTAPSCPVCAAAMVGRTARKGDNAGKAFWGCSGYPVCKGTRAAAV